MARAVAMLLLLLVACGAARQAAAQSGPPRHEAPSAAASAVAPLPPALAGFRRAGPVSDFERLAGGVGMGASARYVPAAGERISATVFIYDRGRPRRPDGAGSADLTEELRLTQAELDAVVRMGRYRSAAFEAGMDVGDRARPDSMRCATFRLVQQDGTSTGDAVCLSVQLGTFVKVRVTSWSNPEPTAAGLIAAGLLSAVLETRKAGG